MDEDVDWFGWAVDSCAALAFAAAAGWSGAQLVSPPMGLAAASAGFLIAFVLLQIAGSGGRRFHLPALAVASWNEVLEATGPLLLDEPLPGDGRVVRLKLRQSGPTPGQLGQTIDDYLATKKPNSTAPDDVVLLGADASAALRHAFGELKRSLR